LFVNIATIYVPSCCWYLHQTTANLDGKGGWKWTSYPIDINCGHCHQLTIKRRIIIHDISQIVVPRAHGALIRRATSPSLGTSGYAKQPVAEIDTPPPYRLCLESAKEYGNCIGVRILHFANKKTGPAFKGSNIKGLKVHGLCGMGNRTQHAAMTPSGQTGPCSKCHQEMVPL